MADAPIYDINVQDYLDAHAPGFKFAGFDNGKPIAENDKGEIADIDPSQILSSQKLDPKHLGDVTYNRPEDALSESPLSLEDRLKTSFMVQPEEKVKFLKANYGDVQHHPGRGLLVKKGGAWREVDPSFFGDGDLGRFMQGVIRANNAIMPALPDGSRTPRKNLSIAEGAGSLWNNTKEVAGGLGQAGTEVLKGGYGAAKNTLNGNNFVDLAGDIADIPSDVINAALTTAGATVAGAPGAAGGAMLATALNAKIGQRLGVNSQSSAEVAQDALLNGALSGGAQFLAATSRPEVDAILKGAGVGEATGPKALIDGLKSFGSSTSSLAKSSYAGLVQALTGRSEEATISLMTHPTVVVKRIGEYLHAASGNIITKTKEALKTANTKKRELFSGLANDVSDAQTEQWVQNSRALVNSAGVKDFTLQGREVRQGLSAVLERANVGHIVDESLNTGAKTAGSKSVKDIGKNLAKNLEARAAVNKELAAAKKSLESRTRSMGGIVSDFDDEMSLKLKDRIAAAEKRVAELSDESVGLRKDLTVAQGEKSAAVKRGSKFRAFEGEGRIESGQGASNVEQQFHQQIQSMVDQIAELEAKGQVTGKRAANLLVDYRKKLSGIARGIADQAGGWHTQKGATAAKLLDGIDDMLGKFAEKGGIAKEWGTLIDSHRATATAVKEFRKALEDQTGESIDKLLKRVLSKPGSNEATKDIYHTAVGLLGDKGKHQVEQLGIEHAVESFLQLKPNFGFQQGATIGGLIAGGIKSTLAVGTGGLVLAASSPRLAARGAAAGSAINRSMSQRAGKVFYLLENMNPQARGQFLRSPPAMDAITRSVIESVAHEAQLTDQAHQAIEQAASGGPQAR